MKMNFLAGILLVGGILSAAPTILIPFGGGNWQDAPTAPQAGEQLTGGSNVNAYWNNITDDSTTCANIGCYVEGQIGGVTNGGYLPSPGWTNPVYLGGANGSAVENFAFVENGTTGTTMKAEIAGLRRKNWLGWYDSSLDIDDLTVGQLGSAFGVIYDGVASPSNSTQFFNPTSNFGLWFITGLDPTTTTTADILSALQTSSQARFTQSVQNENNAVVNPNGVNNNQYFAVFAKNSAATTTLPVTYYVGIEDANFPGGDKDYNDMVISLTIAPEPGFYGMLALGFVGLGLARRRR